MTIQDYTGIYKTIQDYIGLYMTVIEENNGFVDSYGKLGKDRSKNGIMQLEVKEYSTEERNL